MSGTPKHPAVQHAVHLRKQLHRNRMSAVGKVNDWAASHLAIVFGAVWTTWVFFIWPLVAQFMPLVVQVKTSYYAQSWIQLFALSLFVWVGNKLQRSSDAQSEVQHQAQTHIATVVDQCADRLDLDTQGGLAVILSEVRDAKNAAETAAEAMKMLTSVLTPKTPMVRKGPRKEGQ